MVEETRRRRGGLKHGSLSGFTLVELLVVIAIIGVLVGLLLPAIQAARESARRASCTNNSKQVALAFQTYESAKKALPALDYGAAGDFGTWQVAILPFIEQQQLFDRYQGFMIGPLSKAYGTPVNYPVTTSVIPGLLCPSDSGDIKTNQPGSPTKHNYVVNGGNTCRVADDASTSAGNQNPYPGGGAGGVAWGGAPFIRHGSSAAGVYRGVVRLRNVSDGLSRTLAASETVRGINPAAPNSDLRGFTWWGPGAGFQAYYQPNTPTFDMFQSSNNCNNLPERNLPCSVNPAIQLFARSRHPGGVMASMCDASVRFFTDNIDLQAWRSLSTARGGETLSE